MLEVIQKEYINELLTKFPIGIKVLFTHKLQKWQNSKDDSTSKSAVNDSPPTTNTTPANIPSSMGICLDEVLSLSSTGKMIVDYYKSHKKLNNNIRTLLVDTIISCIITTKIPMSVNLASNIGSDIVKMFPSEVKVCLTNVLYK